MHSTKKNGKNMRPRAEDYRISNIAKKVDRTPMTILRWEKIGLIPKARRDSRGWRIYSEADIALIVELVKQTNYFRKK